METEDTLDLISLGIIALVLAFIVYEVAKGLSSGPASAVGGIVSSAATGVSGAIDTLTGQGSNAELFYDGVVNLLTVGNLNGDTSED